MVIRGITMHLRRRETAVIIGGSGAGKTTLLRMLIGLEKPSTGHIWVDGEDIGRLNEYQMNRVRQKFGMVFQYAALLDSLNVLDNVAFPLREHRKHLSRKEIDDKVVSMLNLLGLENKEHRMPSELSGGQRKRVGPGAGADARAADPHLRRADAAASIRSRAAWSTTSSRRRASASTSPAWSSPTTWRARSASPTRRSWW